MPICPNCSVDAVGTKAVSLCTECATTTVAGASFSLLAVGVGVISVGFVVVAVRVLWGRCSRCDGLAHAGQAAVV